MLRYFAVALALLTSPASSGNFKGDDMSIRWFDAKYMCESGKNLQTGEIAAPGRMGGPLPEFS